MKLNNRMTGIAEYHFKQIDEIKNKLRIEGKEILDLGIGDPDLKVDGSIISALIEGINEKEYNKYPPYEGIIELKRAIIKYYDEIYNVNLSEEEVLILIGSKEGINNIIPAVCNIGDCAILPRPAYTVYETCCQLWGVETYTVSLKESRGYLPDLSQIPEAVLLKSKLFIINYPNNPTGAIANEDFYKEISKLCSKYDIVLCNDGAYNEIIEENKKPISLLQFDKKKQCIEFGTFSKTYNMSGFRIGYAVGNKEVIKALLKIKSNTDSGQFKPIQYAALQALKLDRNYINNMRRIYDERKKLVQDLLTNIGVSFYKGGGTFYIWCRIPKNYSLNEYCKELLEKYGILVTPGSAFGDITHSYFRIAVTKEKECIERALSKMGNL